MSREQNQNATLAVYVDESGNTRDVALATSLQGNQPSFALVGVAEPQDSYALDDIAAMIRDKCNIATRELKGRAVDRHPELFHLLAEALYDRGIPVFAELMDKHYYVVTNI